MPRKTCKKSGNRHCATVVCGAVRFERAALSLPLDFRSGMTEYKIEARTYYSKITTNKNHIVESSSEEIQDLLNQYADEGWRLASTDATSFGLAVYVYLYFEREAPAT